MKRFGVKLSRPSRNLKLFSSRRQFSSESRSLKTYLPNSFEDEYYKMWVKKGSFQPKAGQKVFSLVLPPPNVTGSLHLGHTLTVTTLDTLARWRRMCGDEVLCVPGLDHGGIATQVLVEKTLAKHKIPKTSLGRERFLDEMWTWKNSKSSIICNQLKTLGLSCDWTQEYFTMDDSQAKAVVEALLLLWNKDLLYRDESLVNWSPHLQSTISDIEVNHVEINGPTSFSVPGYSRPIEFGNLVDFAYKVIGSDEEIIVSTTRIETMLGDVAVAVNPNDDRYRHLWGSVLLHPFTGAEIPLILDYNVDPQFGSGALKITPAHDRTDFLIAKSHNLPIVTIINEEGLLQECGAFSGMKRYDARDAICNALAEKGLLRGSRPHKMSVPVCSRSGDIIELLIKPQWFLKCKGMAEKAIAAVKEKKLIITPDRFCDDWYNWLENIQDWCISRQLWWGHQLPFYLCEGGGKQVWFPARNEKEANEVANASLDGPVTISRDPDVLDTWFSSALVPFSCLGWPENTEYLRRYYPLSSLVTGNDILFFWVARMVMLGLELTDQLPFKEIFLHGIICDSQGKKMSKSRGNGIEPEDIIKGVTFEEMSNRVTGTFLTDDESKEAIAELRKLYPHGIPACGVDALRFSLLLNNVKNQYINFDVKECDGARRFCNKLWQACNFTIRWLEKYKEADESSIGPEALGLMDKWILLKLNLVISEVNVALHGRDFHLATNALRKFIHHELCDIYIESVKPLFLRGKAAEVIPALSVLKYSLEASLKCLSPFMPFITEHLHQILTGKHEVLLESSFPSVNEKIIDHKVEQRVSFALDTVHKIRKIKHDYGINNQNAEVWFFSDKQNVNDLKEVIETLGHCTLLFGRPNMEEKSWKEESVTEGTSLFINLNVCLPKKKVDLSSVTKRKNKLKKELEKLMLVTSNDGYLKAPPQVRQSHQDKIFKLKTELQKIESTMEELLERERNVS